MYQNKTIGIWGLGKVGISTAQFMHAQNAHIIGMDKKLITHELIKTVFTEDNKDIFFAQADYIVASPGIDIRHCYLQYKGKWISELDLFYQCWKKPIIAITGSVGKTTVTHLLGQFLQHYGCTAAIGGNIGNPMLEMIEMQKSYDCAVVEVSSFQLEYCNQFAPSIAIWTNFSPNHLDRHTIEEYFRAKANICALQNNEQISIIPYSIYETMRGIFPERTWHILCEIQMPDPGLKQLIAEGNTVYMLQNNKIIKIDQQGANELLGIDLLPTITFTQNWLAIIATLDVLRYQTNKIPAFSHDITVPAHRMEKIAVGSITFYNDSKATTIASTQAAIKQLSEKKPIVLLGGLSKGVDRSRLIQELRGDVKRIVCFGKEQQSLHRFCIQSLIPSSGHDTLEEAFAECTKSLEDGDTILLSPSGSSYDLFENYEERGNRFKQLISSFANRYCTETKHDDTL